MVFRLLKAASGSEKRKRHSSHAAAAAATVHWSQICGDLYFTSKFATLEKDSFADEQYNNWKNAGLVFGIVKSTSSDGKGGLALRQVW